MILIPHPGEAEGSRMEIPGGLPPRAVALGWFTLAGPFIPSPLLFLFLPHTADRVLQWVALHFYCRISKPPTPGPQPARWLWNPESPAAEDSQGELWTRFLCGPDLV